MKKSVKIKKITGTREGMEFETEEGKFTLFFKEMAQFVGVPMPDGDTIVIETSDDGGPAKLAVGRMVLNVPEYFLKEKGLI